jgi:hypothetical protein
MSLIHKEQPFRRIAGLVAIGGKADIGTECPKGRF